MSRLTALVPAAVCAGALGRDWPDDLDGQVRCIDEGSRALGLAYCCAPWSTEAEDAALRAELGMDASLVAGPGGNAAASAAGPAGEAVVDDVFERLNEVAAGLARTPGAPPVLGVVSGPLGWGSRHATATGTGTGLALDPVEAVDAAADVAADRLRALAGCGVELVAVVEPGVPELNVDPALAAELHGPLVNAAAHLRLGLVLVATGTIPAEALGYGCWVSSRGCSPGLGFLPGSVLRAEPDLRRFLARAMDRPDDGEVVTAPLEDRVSPDLVRLAAATLAGPAPGALP